MCNTVHHVRWRHIIVIDMSMLTLTCDQKSPVCGAPQSDNDGTSAAEGKYRWHERQQRSATISSEPARSAYASHAPKSGGGRSGSSNGATKPPCRGGKKFDVLPPHPCEKVPCKLTGGETMPAL